MNVAHGDLSTAIRQAASEREALAVGTKLIFADQA
jgi:hypothetical protein